ncbi:nuclear receptor ROR-gamma [Elysia marginata]|uniref:Nuclear receptor ROR-gamma n=1 Tax=Elysia marginata TaxID=1093978 RepID=A0AAV4G300_9GAST|nr:nuclear receptor ROR-gamma [Elysia marginata]
MPDNRFEFWFAGAYKGYSPKFQIAVNPNGFSYHKDEIRKTLPMDAHELLFEIAGSLRRINLTVKEHIVAQTMILFFPDRAPLKDRAAVESLQATLLTCLEYLISQRPSELDRVRGLTNAIDMQIAIRRLCGVDETKVEKHGWLDNLYHVKLKFLEEEMSYVENDHAL